MICPIELGIEFFEGLTAIDEAIVHAAAEARCAVCGGPLHRGDYPRKARGGLLGAFGDTFDRRFSLCCGRRGCRKRATPPSMRFLGRRVYVGAIVIAASAAMLAATTVASAVRATGIAARTLRRWARWWRGPFTQTGVFARLEGRMVPAVDRRRLPACLLDRLSGDPADRVGRLLSWLAPLTTTSMPDPARFVRGAM